METEIKMQKDKILTSPDCEDIYMPLSVLHDKRLKSSEKFYVAMYYQYGDNEYYADRQFLKMSSKQGLLRIKRRLRSLNIIKNINNYELAKETVLQQKGIGGVCEWCGQRTNAIQEHHYPIPKNKGGKSIVKICPNCHYEYHLIIKG